MYDAIIKLRNNKTNLILPTRATGLIKSSDINFDGWKTRQEAGKWMSNFKKVMNKSQKDVSVISYKITDDLKPDVVALSRYGDEYKFIYAGDDEWVINFNDASVGITLDPEIKDKIIAIDPPGGLFNGSMLSVGQKIHEMHDMIVDAIVYAHGSYIIKMKNE